MINIEDFKKIGIRVGEIMGVSLIDGSDKLLMLRVDFGQFGERKILSGIRKFFSDQASLVGLKCPFLFNLESREIMGFKSEGMLLACGDDEDFSLLKADEKISSGSLVR